MIFFFFEDRIFLFWKNKSTSRKIDKKVLTYLEGRKSAYYYLNLLFCIFTYASNPELKRVKNKELFNNRKLSVNLFILLSRFYDILGPSSPHFELLSITD